MIKLKSAVLCEDDIQTVDGRRSWMRFKAENSPFLGRYGPFWRGVSVDIACFRGFRTHLRLALASWPIQRVA